MGLSLKGLTNESIVFDFDQWENQLRNDKTADSSSVFKFNRQWQLIKISLGGIFLELLSPNPLEKKSPPPRFLNYFKFRSFTGWEKENNWREIFPFFQISIQFPSVSFNFPGERGRPLGFPGGASPNYPPPPLPSAATVTCFITYYF